MKRSAFNQPLISGIISILLFLSTHATFSIFFWNLNHDKWDFNMSTKNLHYDAKVCTGKAHNFGLYVSSFQRQIFKHVPKSKWIPLTKISWIPRTNSCNVNFVGTFVLLRNPQQANKASCSGFRSCKWFSQIVSEIRKYKWNPQTICGFHLQFADSTYNLRIPLTVADSATAYRKYTLVLVSVCGFHKLFWFPQIQLGIPQFLPIFGAILSGTRF